MWTSIKTMRTTALAGSLRTAVIAVLGLLAAATTTQAAPVQYVKLCTLYGAGFFYIPGTDTCVNTRQIVDNQIGIAHAMTRAATGTAMATALVTPFLPDGTNYAVSLHWAGFSGQHAVGFAGMIRLRGNLALSAGVALGLDQGRLLTTIERTQTEFGTSVPAESWSEIRVLGRVGLSYAW